MHPSRFALINGPILRVLVLSALVLLGFGLTALIAAFALAWLPPPSFLTPGQITLSILCGLIVWLFLAAFHLKTDTVCLFVGDRARFCARLNAVLCELGYEVKTEGNDRLVVRPGFRSWLMGGRLQVQFEEAGARITGPKLFVEMVRSRMRLGGHIAKAHEAAQDSRWRAGERLLKRVEVSVRFPAEQAALVQSEVIDALAQEGAQVLCNLVILAQSEDGIREQLVEEEIRQRLRARQLPVQVLKDFPQWEEPPWLDLGEAGIRDQ